MELTANTSRGELERSADGARDLIAAARRREDQDAGEGRA